MSSLYHILLRRNSDTFLSGADRPALIRTQTPTRIVPLPPQIQIQIQIVAHVRKGQNAVGADPGPATPKPLVPVPALVQCRAPLHGDGIPPVHGRGL